MATLTSRNTHALAGRHRNRNRYHFAPRAKAAILIAVALAVMALGAVFPPGPWHAALVKPDWNPPNWLFAPVWTTLYVLMTAAAWRIWRLPESQARHEAMVLYALQLAANAAWTPIFFGAHAPAIAFANIVLLDMLVLWTAVYFYPLDKPAGCMLLPYLAWITFATALNAAIVWLN